MVSGRPLDGVWEMPGRSLEGLEKVSGRCPKRMGSLKYQNLSVIEGVFRSFSHDLVLIQNYPQINFFYHGRFSVRK